MLLTGLYRTLIRPFLFQMDAEEAHDLGQKLFPCGAVLGRVACTGLGEKFQSRLPLLEIDLAGAVLSSPIGLAAGFDKRGMLVEHLADLGFAYGEIGSVTARASQGNPRPRLFRLPDDGAVINRLGLNGPGAAAVAHRLAGRVTPLPMAVNIAKTNMAGLEGAAAVEDILTSFRAIKNTRPLYVTINTSCPNTHEGALRETSELEAILQAVQVENLSRLPVFLKLSPDLDEKLISSFIEIASNHGISGFVCGNTTTSRDCLKSDLAFVKRIGAGGLSGEPLKNKSLSLVRSLAELKRPEQEIIACGGIACASDVFNAIAAGASSVQLYTALVYHGPFLVYEILAEMAERLSAASLTLRQLKGNPGFLSRL